jgi:hypothetical protein
LEELERVKECAEQRRREVDKALCENNALREALQVSEQKVVELTRLQSDISAEKADDMDKGEAGPDPSFLTVPMNPEQSKAWGCTSERVYSQALLLAHRSIAERIADGPPGLELEVPPGLAQWDESISVRPRL